MGNIETYDTGSVMDVALGTTGMPVLYSTILYCTLDGTLQYCKALDETILYFTKLYNRVVKTRDSS